MFFQVILLVNVPRAMAGVGTIEAVECGEAVIIIAAVAAEALSVTNATGMYCLCP